MRLIHALALIGLAVLVPLGNPGCSKYGEGSICDPLNTDPQTGISNDCDDGLQCTQSLCADTAICCPPPGHTVTSPACNGSLMNCGTGGGTNTGGTNPGTSVGGFGGSGGAGGGPPMCPHDQCEVGVQLLAGFETVKGKQVPICSDCVNLICNGDGTAEHPPDMSCCTHDWDASCVGKVKMICNLNCNLGTGGSGGTGGTTPTGSGGTAGASSSTGT